MAHKSRSSRPKIPYLNLETVLEEKVLPFLRWRNEKMVQWRQEHYARLYTDQEIVGRRDMSGALVPCPRELAVAGTDILVAEKGPDETRAWIVMAPEVFKTFFEQPAKRLRKNAFCKVFFVPVPAFVVMRRFRVSFKVEGRRVNTIAEYGDYCYRLPGTPTRFIFCPKASLMDFFYNVPPVRHMIMR